MHARVCKVFRDYLVQSGARPHLDKILRGAPEWLRRLDSLFSRFEDTMLHSHKCIVRARFFHMPRGRQLKRLERSVPLANMKEFLVEVFADFYPAWAYENVYAELIDRLPFDDVASQGYCFQVDWAWRAVRAGARVTEVPITFAERELGRSKMSGSIVREALVRVTVWGLHDRLADWLPNRVRRPVPEQTRDGR